MAEAEEFELPLQEVPLNAVDRWAYPPFVDWNRGLTIGLRPDRIMYYDLSAKNRTYQECGYTPFENKFDVPLQIEMFMSQSKLVQKLNAEYVIDIDMARTDADAHEIFASGMFRLIVLK